MSKCVYVDNTCVSMCVYVCGCTLIESLKEPIRIHEFLPLVVHVTTVLCSMYKTVRETT